MRASSTGSATSRASTSTSWSGTTDGSLPSSPTGRVTGKAATRATRTAVIDVAGDTLLAGLVDCHAHYTIDARLQVMDGIWNAHAIDDASTAAFIGARNARDALNAGVTLARSAGAAHSRDIPLRDAIAAGHVPGPRLLAAGGSITITGGHGWQFGYEADGIPEMIKLVRRLARDGNDHYKIVASEAAQITSAVAGVEELTLDEVSAIVREARRLHRRVMSHAQSSGAVISSARGGVDSVEHAFLADRGALETLKECGTTLVPTLTVTDVWSDLPGASDAVRANQANLSVVHRQSCQTAIELGIPLATGTDCGVRGVLLGHGLARDLEHARSRAVGDGRDQGRHRERRAPAGPRRTTSGRSRSASGPTSSSRPAIRCTTSDGWRRCAWSCRTATSFAATDARRRRRGAGRPRRPGWWQAPGLRRRLAKLRAAGAWPRAQGRRVSRRAAGMGARMAAVAAGWTSAGAPHAAASALVQRLEQADRLGRHALAFPGPDVAPAAVHLVLAVREGLARGHVLERVRVVRGDDRLAERRRATGRQAVLEEDLTRVHDEREVGSQRDGGDARPPLLLQRPSHDQRVADRHDPRELRRPWRPTRRPAPCSAIGGNGSSSNGDLRHRDAE